MFGQSSMTADQKLGLFRKLIAELFGECTVEGSVISSKPNGVDFDYDVVKDAIKCEDSELVDLFKESRRHSMATIPAVPDASRLLGVKKENSLEGFVKAEVLEPP